MRSLTRIGLALLFFAQLSSIGFAPSGRSTTHAGPRPPVNGAQETTQQPRFRDNRDGAVTDSKTGLMWTKKDSGTSLAWEAARSYCGSLTTVGTRDWRLPSIDELAALYDASHSWKLPKIPSWWKGDDMHIDRVFSLSHPAFWSSSKMGGETASLFEFYTGQRQQSHIAIGFRALCVRKP